MPNRRSCVDRSSYPVDNIYLHFISLDSFEIEISFVHSWYHLIPDDSSTVLTADKPI